MNRYVKIEGYPNWFLVLERGEIEPDGLSQTMQKKLFRNEASKLLNTEKHDAITRMIAVANNHIDYTSITERCGTILIRPNGSYMTLRGDKIEKERFDNHFPIEDKADIVICENDEKAEYKFVSFLKKRFPGVSIATINYFDLRSDEEIREYFDNAKYVTFSTTFTSLEWYEKLARHKKEDHKVIGYCHIPENWESALNIMPEVEVIKTI